MPKRTGLSREAIAQAALDLLDAEGLDGVTMRRLAGHLEVSPMSLYSYFTDREALLEAATQLVYEGIEPPAPGPDPRRTLQALMHGVRDVLLAHPHALPLVATYPPRTLTALRFVEAGYRALRDAGVPAVDTARAYRALAAYSLGTALVETNHYFTGSYDGAPDPATLAAQLPNVAEVGPLLGRLDDLAEFDYGLDLTLDGFLLRHARR